MQQHEFIFICRASEHLGGVKQDEAGNTFVFIRDQIKLNHNYKKKDLVTIRFTETGDTYKIETKKQLDHIVKLHMDNENVEQIMRRYCDENLGKL